MRKDNHVPRIADEVTGSMSFNKRFHRSLLYNEQNGLYDIRPHWWAYHSAWLDLHFGIMVGLVPNTQPSSMEE